MYKSVDKEPLHCWRFRPSQLRGSPSSADGMCSRMEQQLRRAGCAFISSMAERLFEPERMRGPATTAMILFQRFFMRQSFLKHDRSVVATAALFLAAKVEEQHRRVKHLVDASYCVLHGADRPPFEEASLEWRTRRDALLETERILLYTLEFDVAIEQPYGMVTTQLRRWRDGGVFGSRFDKIPELAALDRAAAALIFACMSTDLPLLFTTREVAFGSLYAAYQLSPSAVQQRLRLQEPLLQGLVDRGVLAAFMERLTAALEGMLAGEEALRAALPHLVLLPSAAPPLQAVPQHVLAAAGYVGPGAASASIGGSAAAGASAAAPPYSSSGGGASSASAGWRGWVAPGLGGHVPAPTLHPDVGQPPPEAAAATNALLASLAVSLHGGGGGGGAGSVAGSALPPAGAAAAAPVASSLAFTYTSIASGVQPDAASTVSDTAPTRPDGMMQEG